jgi:hypothetical protein
VGRRGRKVGDSEEEVAQTMHMPMNKHKNNNLFFKNKSSK